MARVFIMGQGPRTAKHQHLADVVLVILFHHTVIWSSGLPVAIGALSISPGGADGGGKDGELHFELCEYSMKGSENGRMRWS